MLTVNVDLLMRAAKTLREHAEAATRGPWEHVDHADPGDPETYTTYMGCGSVATMDPDLAGGDIAAPNGDLYPRSGYSPKDDMAYIALVNPTVGLALATWLEYEATVEKFGAFELSRQVVSEEALEVARAILREE